MLSTFICYKIDDVVAADVPDTKLSEIGMLYGDILAYRHAFKSNKIQTKSYEEKAEELRKKIRRNHQFGMSKSKRSVKGQDSFNVTFSLKCMEKKAYAVKR